MSYVRQFHKGSVTVQNRNRNTEMNDLNKGGKKDQTQN